MCDNTCDNSCGIRHPRAAHNNTCAAHNTLVILMRAPSAMLTSC